MITKNQATNLRRLISTATERKLEYTQAYMECDQNLRDYVTALDAAETSLNAYIDRITDDDTQAKT